MLLWNIWGGKADQSNRRRKTKYDSSLLYYSALPTIYFETILGLLDEKKEV